MKDMKQLLKEPSAASKSRSERSSDKSGMQTISLSSFAGNKGGLDYSGTKKKPVFAAITQSKSSQQLASASSILGSALNVDDPSTATAENDPSGAVRNGWYRDRYDPRSITGCDADCVVCHGRDDAIRL